jgi:hypothetical protein
LNRIGIDVGTRGIRCPICKHDLPNPTIHQRLESIAIGLREIQRDYRRFDLRGYEEVQRRLNKQIAILNNLSMFPGYVSTRRAAFDLAVEIEDLVYQLEVALGKHISITLREIFREVLGLVRQRVMPALGSGERKA